jgi:hypothetical protein
LLRDEVYDSKNAVHRKSPRADEPINPLKTDRSGRDTASGAGSLSVCAQMAYPADRPGQRAGDGEPMQFLRDLEGAAASMPWPSIRD